jgi:uncharacterized protein YndB with AHSA1/START domain
MTGDESERRIELEVEVPGTPEEVWEAIATGPGISAWMHPAEVEGREGGRFAYDLGGGMRESGRVTGWEPPHRFAQEEQWSTEGEEPVTLATEWLVEARAGGTCVVRMVMSGFGPGARWEDEIGGVAEGMKGGLACLRLYMTHFRGRRGAWIRAFGDRPAPRDERWEALCGGLGLTGTAAGQPVTTSGDGVPALAGVVEEVVEERWHRGVLLRLADPAPGLAHVLVYGDDGGATIQACVYGDDAAAVAAREEPAWRQWMEARFSTAAA